MLVKITRSLITLALVVSSANVSAFTPPKTSGIAPTNTKKLSPSTCSIPLPIRTNQTHKSIGSPLQLLKEDMSTSTTDETKPLLGAIERPEDIDNGRNDLIAPTIFASFTAALIFIIYELRDAIVTTTLGSKALAFVTGALIWDNLIISIGSFFFKDIETNPTKYKILETLSYPRFTLHAVGVPLQCITIAEMGKFAGVGYLQSDIVQYGVIILAIVVAIADRLKFANSPGIERTIWDQPPWEALERDLVKFGYVEVEFAYIIPAIVLSLSSLIVGISALKAGVEPEVGKWMIFTGLSALIGNALPGSMMTFTGNLGEAGMQFGLLEAARIVYGGM